MYYLCWPWIVDQKVDGYADNPEKSSTTKIGENVPCRYSTSAIWTFNHIENMHSLYCGEDNENIITISYKLKFIDIKFCQ